MPAFDALSMPGTPWACEVTFLPSRCASSAAAASSSMRIRRVARVRAGRHAATGGHDLDPVGTLVLEQPADRLAHARDAIGLAAEEVAVAAGLGDRPAADEQARPEGQARARSRRGSRRRSSRARRSRRRW